MSIASEWCRLLLQNQGNGFSWSFSSERHMCGDHFVENRSEAPKVCTRIDVGSLSLLRRHVVSRAHHGAGASVDHCFSGRFGVGGRTGRLSQFGEAKIQNLDVAVAPDHDVLRLDIAMDDAGGVRGREGAVCLNRNLEFLQQLHPDVDALAPSLAMSLLEILEVPVQPTSARPAAHAAGI